jgi:hypothetical protein
MLQTGYPPSALRRFTVIYQMKLQCHGPTLGNMATRSSWEQSTNTGLLQAYCKAHISIGAAAWLPAIPGSSGKTGGQPLAATHHIRMGLPSESYPSTP